MANLAIVISSCLSESRTEANARQSIYVNMPLTHTIINQLFTELLPYVYEPMDMDMKEAIYM
jgi:bifunctional DNase/RNase